MTSHFDVRLRSRVLYYWAVSRNEPVVEISASSLKHLLMLDDRSDSLTDAIVKDIGLAFTVTMNNEGGLRMQVVATDKHLDVYLHWQIKTGQTRTKFTAARRSKINARLADGYTVTQLKQAVDGIMRSKWHRGDNPQRTPYLSIDMVFRNADNVDRFMAQGLGDTTTIDDDDDVDSIRSEWADKRK